MENLMTNISAWGITFVVLTTLRISWPLRLTNRTSALPYGFLSFIQHAYKPLTVFVLASAALWICHDIMAYKPVNVWFSAVVAGAGTVGISIALRYLVARELVKVEQMIDSFGRTTTGTINSLGKAASTLFDNKSTANAGMLLLGLISFFAVFVAYSTAITWDVYAVLSFLSSFAMGGAGMLVYVKMNQWDAIHAETGIYDAFTNYCDEVISRDRFDALVGAIVAALLLGTTFSELNSFKRLAISEGAVLLPLALAITGVVISVVTVLVSKVSSWANSHLRVLAEKMASVLLMIIAAFGLTHWLLPSTWVMGGVEYSEMEVFYAAEAGIIGGLLASKVIHLYRAVHDKYLAYLTKKSLKTTFLDKVFHGVVNGISFITPLALIVFAILFSYQTVGLYGILIAMITMLSNLTTKLTTEVAPQ